MSQINSLLAYKDCEELFQRAQEDPRGARALIGTYEQCMHMRTRMHYFRKLDRRANLSTYPEGSALHGCSVYDPLVVRIVRDEDNAFWLYVEPRGVGSMVIEGLSEPHLLADNVTDTEAHEVHQIEDHSK